MYPCCYVICVPYSDMCFEAGLTHTHTEDGNCCSTTEAPGNSVYIIVHCRCESFVWKISVLKFLRKYMIPENHKTLFLY